MIDIGHIGSFQMLPALERSARPHYREHLLFPRSRCIYQPSLDELFEKLGGIATLAEIVIHPPFDPAAEESDDDPLTATQASSHKCMVQHLKIRNDMGKKNLTSSDHECMVFLT